MFRFLSKHKNQDTDWIPHPNIITPNLVLGGINFVQDSSRIDLVKQLYGVTHVLCCCDEVDESKGSINLDAVLGNKDGNGSSNNGSGVSFLRCVIGDLSWSDQQWQSLLECFRFLDQASIMDSTTTSEEQQGEENSDSKSSTLQVRPLYSDDEKEVEMGQKVVYVHCMRGRSRSATVVIGYLMYRYHLSLEEAYNYLKHRRVFIGPHEWLKRQLIHMQAKIVEEVAKVNPARAAEITLWTLAELKKRERLDWHTMHVSHQTKALIEYGINEAALDEAEELNEDELIKGELAEVQGKAQNQHKASQPNEKSGCILQ